MGISNILELVDDLDEPACMDKILMYLEEIKDEDFMFMELLLARLRGEEITWERPWYQQTNSVSRPLKENNEAQAESYKTDTICKDENDQILRNWYEFIEIYDIPDKIICLARWRNKDKSRLPKTPEECARRFVISYLARGLQRTPFQVFRHIQTYFGGPVKGPYSPDEEKIMQVCFTHHPNNSVTLLSMVLAREPRGIYKRLKQMYDGKPIKKKIKWTLPLATTFVKRLMKFEGLPLEELRNKKIEKETWLKMGQKFDHNYVYLQRFWCDKLHTQIFIQQRVKLNKLRKQIFKRIKQSSYKIWSDIRWKEIARDFPQEYSHYFLYGLCYRLVQKKDKYQKEPLPDVIDHALQKLKMCPKRRLRTLKLNENGELEEVLYKK